MVCFPGSNFHLQKIPVGYGAAAGMIPMAKERKPEIRREPEWEGVAAGFLHMKFMVLRSPLKFKYDAGPGAFAVELFCTIIAGETQQP